MASYPKLLSALLEAGLAKVGFIKSAGYLIRDSGECIGGLYFQKSRYESNDFFVEAGVLSKRLDRFHRLGQTSDDRKLYDWQRAQFRTRLTSPAADRHVDQWSLRTSRPLDELVSRLAPVLLTDALHVFDALSDDRKLLAALVSDDKPCGKKAWRDIEWPPRSTAFVYAAVLAHDLCPEMEAQYAALALEAAHTSLTRQQVQEQLDRIGHPTYESTDMIPEEALEQLRKLTGQDFGKDCQAWHRWLKENRGQ